MFQQEKFGGDSVSDAILTQGHRVSYSVCDFAYAILKERRQPMKYKDLILEALRLQGVLTEDQGPKLLAKTHTQISLDNRFLNRGGGLCGLKEWTIKPPKYKVVEVSSGDRPKPGERLRRELVAIDEDYEKAPVEEEEEPLGEPEEPEEG